jgi:hypothetical protein
MTPSPTRVASRWIAAYTVDKQRLALFQKGQVGGRSVILYDATKLRGAALDEDEYWDSGTEESMLGYVEFSDSVDCDDEVYEINRIAAVKGYGPLLYDVALSYAKTDGMEGVVPDRNRVSPAALKVWEYYFDRRSDVSKTWLRDTSLNCGHLGDVLNHVYSLSAPMPWIRSLESNHRATAQHLSELGIHYNDDEVEMHLWEAGDSMFRSMYFG